MESGRETHAFRSPVPVLAPRSVAIVGASERPWPRLIYGNLRDFGYPGPIYPVNPRAREVWGVRCWPDLASLPEPVQHAAVIIPAAQVQSVLEAGVGVGLRSATVYASNLGDGTDPGSLARGEALRAFVESSGLRLCGPNCMGGMSVRERYFAYPNRQLCALPAGSVGFVSQSGGTVQFLAKSAADRGVKFSYMLSSGNELDLDLADYVAHLVDDPHTKIIALFIEGVRRPQTFLAAAARALAAGKPIVAIKTGKSQKSREAAKSHTGAVAGDYAAFEAMCERYGIITCASLDDMVEILLALQGERLPRGPRVGWVTTSGGTVDLLYDYLEDMPGQDMPGQDMPGLELPEFAPAAIEAMSPYIPKEMTLSNPLDCGIPSTDANAAAICKAVLEDPNVDMLAWASTLPTGKGPRDAPALRKLLDVSDKPILAFARMNHMVAPEALQFQDEVGFPFLQGLQPTLRALAALAFYGRRRGRDIAPLPAPAAATAPQGEALSAALARVGLPAPASALAETASEAASAAARIGFPVAVKIVSSSVSHKTEVGGVRLDLRSAAEVEEACGSLEQALARAAPGATLEAFLVQEMARGVEMILGARTDPLYGPLIVLGAGGVLVELVRDLAVRLLPVGLQEARQMIAGLKSARLLAGYRGAPACDVEALARAACGLSEFYLDHREVFTDLEINPLIVRPAGLGVCAVDVRAAQKPQGGSNGFRPA
jgi:acyl-CoA synthetase (NDP forming)